MKSMTGICFIFVGIISAIFGAIILLKNNFTTNHLENNTTANHEVSLIAQNAPGAKKSVLSYSLFEGKLMEYNNQESPKSTEVKILLPKRRKITQLAINPKKKGYDFEKYVTKKFNNTQFKLKERDERKYLEGVYVETTRRPDLIYEFTQAEVLDSFAVECKWRKQFQDNEIEIATHQQIENYKIFEKKTGLPVFITLGIGGEPDAPKQLYIIPLNKIFSNKVDLSFLMEFEQVPSRNFFYDYKTKDLLGEPYPGVQEEPYD